MERRDLREYNLIKIQWLSAFILIFGDWWRGIFTVENCSNPDLNIWQQAPLSVLLAAYCLGL